jgi:hypothetical protein
VGVVGRDDEDVRQPQLPGDGRSPLDPRRVGRQELVVQAPDLRGLFGRFVLVALVRDMDDAQAGPAERRWRVQVFARPYGGADDVGWCRSPGPARPRRFLR